MKTKTSICTFILAISAVSTASAENLLEERLAAELPPGASAIFACQRGEQVAVDARGISRVSTDSSKTLKVSADDDTLFITCQELGTTQLVVTRKDRVQTVTVRVGAAEESEVDVTRCGDIRGAKARVVLGRSGRVQHVLVHEASESKASCIRKSLSETSWGESEPFLRVARFEW